MSDLALSRQTSEVASGPTVTSRPPNPTETAPQPNPTQTYPPRTAETPVPRPAEAYAAAGSTSAETAKRSPSPRLFAWQRAWLQALAVIGAAIVGIAFGHVVAGNDPRMQIFFSATVGMGLFFVFSALATQLNRKRRKRLY
jgi:hypothetical protein